MTTAVLMDHVSAYAAAVRAQLADLSPEQVEDLTDGLEADLIEALEDSQRAVPGETGADQVPPEASMLDLTRRFGPAAAYAAELRAAAGLDGPGPRPRRRGTAVRGRVAAVRRRVRAVLDDVLESTVAPFLATPAGRGALSLASLLRPLWWVLRGWLWFVVLKGVSDLLGGPDSSIRRFVPDDPVTWVVFVAALLASLEVGRRRPARVWTRRVVVAASLVAVLFLPWAVSSLEHEIRLRAGREVFYEYVEVPIETPVTPEDGVYVDGMQVSNLFVYDADGNPLEGVQIYDDRGRPVRTTYDEGYEQWMLPGVAEPWTFTPAQDGDGRARWNVYPLMGAPSFAWTYDGDGPVLVEGEELRMPPLPFAKAPAVVVGERSPGSEQVLGSN